MNRQAEGFIAHAAPLTAAGAPYPHESAHLHVAGEAVYVTTSLRSTARCT